MTNPNLINPEWDATVMKNRELVSALADGRLQGDEFARTVSLLGSDSDARASWHQYHLVGDLLRSAEAVNLFEAKGADDAGFVARFQARLARETAAIALAGGSEYAPDSVAGYALPEGNAGTIGLQNQSANDSNFRWKLVAGFASLAAVAAIGWNAIGYAGGSAGNGSGAAQLAQVQAPVVVPVIQPMDTGTAVMIRDPHLDALLAAHKQFGGTSALQMPAGFLRNATFEGGNR
jgi:sigma-E factor negative regulatory protein RseA